MLYLHRESLTRPAPSESPQGRNAARVGGCSGAMLRCFPFFCCCPPFLLTR